MFNTFGQPTALDPLGHFLVVLNKPPFRPMHHAQCPATITPYQRALPPPLQASIEPLDKQDCHPLLGSSVPTPKIDSLDTLSPEMCGDSAKHQATAEPPCAPQGTDRSCDVTTVAQVHCLTVTHPLGNVTGA